MAVCMNIGHCHSHPRHLHPHNFDQTLTAGTREDDWGLNLIIVVIAICMGIIIVIHIIFIHIIHIQIIVIHIFAIHIMIAMIVNGDVKSTLDQRSCDKREVIATIVFLLLK